jgi:hypothetical protein
MIQLRIIEDSGLIPKSKEFQMINCMGNHYSDIPWKWIYERCVKI